MSEEIYDYIIVGAGAAGSVLANRLTERTDLTVLVLEAGGPDSDIWVRIPLGVGKLMHKARYLWQAETSNEEGLLGNRVAWASGRMWGGSTSVNGMLVVRGNSIKYDEWASLGASGWSYRDVLPYFKQIEHCAFGDPTYRGRGGPISIEEADSHALGDAFLAACASAGYPRATDYNGAVPEGAAPFQMNTRNGVRCSTATAYLRPALARKNLRVLSNAVVQQVQIENYRAIGVSYRLSNQLRSARARREVVLSAGAIRSPQLLELSGVGDAEVLNAHGIPVKKHLPGVGSNLQDHLMVRICYEARDAVTIYDLLTNKVHLARELAKYALFRRGIFSTSSFPALAFVRSSPSAPYPDIRIQIGLTSGARRVSTESDFGLDPHSGFHLGGYFIYPRSRGFLHVKSRDANESPSIHARYLTDPLDRDMTLRVLKTLRRIAAQQPLAQYIVKEVRPGLDVADEETLLDYARRNGDTCWHPCGTCQMGTDKDAVVDNQLRVHGIAALRVVDASVFPFLVSSNTNFPTIMLAERAADIILGRAGASPTGLEQRQESFPVEQATAT